MPAGIRALHLTGSAASPTVPCLSSRALDRDSRARRIRDEDPAIRMRSTFPIEAKVLSERAERDRP